MKRGAFLEKLVAAIQEHLKGQENVSIQTNVRLKDRIGNKREIDVLVSGVVQGGLPLKIAFECKDYNRPVDIKELDAFCGKCSDLPQVSICVLVSSAGFTKQVKEAAAQRGIQLCTIDDIKVGTYLTEYEPFGIQIRTTLRCNNCQVSLRDKVCADLINQSVIFRYLDNNEVIDIFAVLAQELALLEHQMELAKIFIEKHGRPFDMDVTLCPPRAVYINDLIGTKYIIENVLVPIHVEALLSPTEVISQKQYTPNEGDRVVITECKSESIASTLVLMESENNHTIFFRQPNGTLLSPSFIVKGNTKQ